MESTYKKENNAPAAHEENCDPHSYPESLCTENSFVKEEDGDLDSSKRQLNQCACKPEALLTAV